MDKKPRNVKIIFEGINLHKPVVLTHAVSMVDIAHVIDQKLKRLRIFSDFMVDNQPTIISPGVIAYPICTYGKLDHHDSLTNFALGMVTVVIFDWKQNKKYFDDAVKSRRIGLRRRRKTRT